MESQDQQDHSMLSPSSKKIKRESLKQPQAPSMTKVKRKHAFWNVDEDSQLMALVPKLGAKWTEIGKIIGGRTGKQVRERYLYTLKPDINKDVWTQEEDSILTSLHKKFGNKWGQIAACLPGRTQNQIKNRFKSKFREVLSPECSPQSTEATSPSLDEALSPIVDLKDLAELNDADDVQNLAEMSPILNFDVITCNKDEAFWSFEDYRGATEHSFYDRNKLGYDDLTFA